MNQTAALHEITQRNVEIIAQMEAESERQRTFGERLADSVATCVGSWAFLIIQIVLLVLWMLANLVRWWAAWDPYPFVLLNLVMSFEAAFATPIILMSQNRQNRIIERRNHLDLQINMLAERETTEQLRLLRLVCERIGIQLNEQQAHALEQLTRPEEIVRQITETVERAKEPETK
jgi:uncharacterized membrane protein